MGVLLGERPVPRPTACALPTMKDSGLLLGGERRTNIPLASPVRGRRVRAGKALALETLRETGRPLWAAAGTTASEELRCLAGAFDMRKVYHEQGAIFKKTTRAAGRTAKRLG